MVDARLEGQRFRLGTWTVSDLTATYELRNETSFPIQTDQDAFVTPWLVRTRDTTPPTRARSVEAMDGTTIEDGFYQFQWSFSYWTFDMAKYWNATKLGGAKTVTATVMTYDANNEAIYLVCKTSKLVFPRDGQPWPGGYRDVIVRFTRGVVIT